MNLECTYKGDVSIRGDTLRWTHMFLKQCQSILANGSHSSKVHVDSGVPRGTGLGPLLFLLCINDLPDCVSSQVRLFADDCLLYRPITSLQDQIQLQDTLKAVTAWADTWWMSFNHLSKYYILSTCENKKFNTYLYQLNSVGVV